MRQAKVVTYNADLFHVAVDALSQCADDKRKAHHAMTSIVFSTASVEAFLSVLVYHSTNGNFERNANYERIKMFADIAPCLERSRQEPESLIQLASATIAGTRLDKGSEPYQSFTDLVALRNWVIHPKPDVRSVTAGEYRMIVGEKASRLLRSLAARGLIESERIELLSTPDLILNTNVALWSCNVAARTVHWLASLLPPEGFVGAVMRSFARNWTEVRPNQVLNAR